MTIKTDELRTTLLAEVISPAELADQFPLTSTGAETVLTARQQVCDILSGDDPRLLVVIGPCSIHDPKAAVEYASKLVELHHKFHQDLFIVMRVYFEKPRTTVGWKGLISDPDLDGSYSANKGLRLARKLLVDITELGLPIGTEFLDMVNGQYIADLITWGAIGARTTESQVHREMASALSCPVGFKNGTDGNIKIATDAVRAAREPHIFYSPNKNGQMCVYRTHGNPFGHIILRGGATPNYDSNSVQEAISGLEKAGVLPKLIVDLSHGNSQKQYKKQLDVADCVMKQLTERHGSGIAGIMAESFLVEGNQSVQPDKPLVYGQSITDSCLNWSDTESLLSKLAIASRSRIEVASTS